MLEIRYNGSHTIHQWLSVNTNEVNVFENGFLNSVQGGAAKPENKRATQHQFLRRQRVCRPDADTHIQCRVCRRGFRGCRRAAGRYGSTSFINDLNTGQVGAMANIMAGANYNPRTSATWWAPVYAVRHQRRVYRRGSRLSY